MHQELSMLEQWLKWNYLQKRERSDLWKNFYSTSFSYGQKCILFNCKNTVMWHECAVLDRLRCFQTALYNISKCLVSVYWKKVPAVIWYNTHCHWALQIKGMRPAALIKEHPSYINEPEHAKTNKMTRAPSEDSDSLCIHTIWSAFSLFAWRNLGP